ncbi:MAG: hypothetical protein CMI03_17150 [Oceanospirillaceae bacterium]|uniref:hypothetical protein n=1 Tax=unclassified Thalassolituus TaxID=2624967 RepID=UPI000C534BBC|nr:MULTISPECIES: hypothetical protein [unclassified Thalassolituus]MBL36687.1 hypothetical protein [Oceanospirillaceae bacterium]MBS54471.1 hypothetical protein [Oceanospirillaceae bacterium]|tara:strand:+ start:3347 stop:4900 length:1554 start_codon:yes stop_codon:yes gene_type:complete
MDSLLTLWSANTAVSATVWLLLAMTLLYFGRRPAHNMLRSTGEGLRNVLRLTSRSLSQLERHLVKRNREVLLAAARNDAERRIEREFTRIQALVARDLSGYPALHRDIASAIDDIEETYRESGENPPLPPAWSEVVNTIAALPSHGDPAVAKVLNNIKGAVEDTHKETLKAWQNSAAQRHKLLARMQPEWRTLNSKMDEVAATVDGLDKRTHQLDKQMAQFEEIRRGEDAAVRSLASSSLTQFFISGLVLTIAVMGGLINFQLIALPMSEMVGGTSYIGALKTSDIAALVIILIEIAMGLFLLESLRVTRLFPMISSMDDRMRRRMMVISLTILCVLAGIEASLAYMRDLLALDREALTQSLTGVTAAASGVAASHAEFRWIPSIGQMVMGFVLPFALAFIAIPLESFIHSLRTVLGLLLVAAIRITAIASRALGNLLEHSARLLMHAYDLLIMVPLSIEHLVISLRHRSQSTDEVADAIPDVSVEEAAEKPARSRKSRGNAKAAEKDADNGAVAAA